MAVASKNFNYHLRTPVTMLVCMAAMSFFVQSAMGADERPPKRSRYTHIVESSGIQGNLLFGNLFLKIISRISGPVRCQKKMSAIEQLYEESIRTRQIGIFERVRDIYFGDPLVSVWESRIVMNFRLWK